MTKLTDRRSFLKKSAALGAVSLTGARGKETEKFSAPFKVRKFNVLGRTGFRVSDIAAGAPSDEAVLSAALDAGVNYIDTGENYSNGRSERIIGKAIRGRDRKSLFINTKLMLEKDLSKERILRRARKCLERLNTDYLDCLMIHNATDVTILDCPGFHEAARQLKEEGRLRFIGITSHGTTWWKNDKTLMSETMEKVCTAAAEDGRFDVFLFIYNYLTKDMGERILKELNRRNLGTTLMKVNPVHNYTLLQDEIREMKERREKITPRDKQIMQEFQAMVDQAQGFIKKYGLKNPREISTAAFRFVMNHPGVHTVCCQMPNFDEMEHWISLSGSPLSSHEKQKLTAFEVGLGSFYCRHGCGICESSCPERIPINTIMRFYHYFSAQRREKEAMLLYAGLDKQWGSHCRQCSGHCQESCPYGVQIQGLLELAHHRLTLA